MSLFSEKLTQAIKKSLEISTNVSFLDFLLLILDETQADMFVMRTLDVKDYENYWEMMRPLFSRSFSNISDQRRYFGPRNAVMTEYFDLIMGKEPEDQREYTIPFYFDEQYIPAEKKHSDLYEGIIEDLRFIVWVPIAEYFALTDVYPETAFFQQREGKKPLTRDGKLVEALRLKYKILFAEAGSAKDFFNEIDLIDLFIDS